MGMLRPARMIGPAPHRIGLLVAQVHDMAKPIALMALGDGFCGYGKTVYGSVEMLLLRSPDVLNIVDPIADEPFIRHQGKANMVFCDGHVESPALKFLFEDTGDEALSRWNRDHRPHREKLSP